MSAVCSALALLLLLAACNESSSSPTPHAYDSSPRRSSSSADRDLDANPDVGSSRAEQLLNSRNESARDNSPSADSGDIHAVSSRGSSAQSVDAAQRGSSGQVATDGFRFFNGEYEVTAEMKNTPPASIAVLPLTEEDEWSVTPGDRTPRDIVRRALYNHLAYLPFRDLELTEVDRRLAEAGLSNPAELRTVAMSDPARLKDVLGVDAVVLGRVTDFDRLYLGLYSEVRVGCSLYMVSLHSGNTLWRVEHETASSAAGVPIDPIGLAVTALSTLWNLREGEFLTQTDDLFREITSTLERELDPALIAQGPPPPKIDLFTCLNADRPFKAGDDISFRMVGDPGCTASVALPGHAENITLLPVSEAVKAEIWEQTLGLVQDQYVETGHSPTPDMLEAIREELHSREIYQGVYTVAPGENAENLVAEAFLEQPGGTRAEA
ncbi:MAG: hypothetical protein D6E12_06070, partial [Desulfovibrio sp.]